MATMTDWSLTGQLGGSQRHMSIGELLQDRLGWRVDGLPTWIVAHRALPESLYTMEGRFDDPVTEPAHYYLRVTQENGQLAWSSPIWFDD